MSKLFTHRCRLGNFSQGLCYRENVLCKDTTTRKKRTGERRDRRKITLEMHDGSAHIFSESWTSVIRMGERIFSRDGGKYFFRLALNAWRIRWRNGSESQVICWDSWRFLETYFWNFESDQRNLEDVNKFIKEFQVLLECVEVLSKW